MSAFPQIMYIYIIHGLKQPSIFQSVDAVITVESSSDLLTGISEDNSVSKRKKICLFETRSGKTEDL